MTNAEWIIENGVRFVDISPIEAGYNPVRRGYKYNIMSVNKACIGHTYIMGKSDEYALRKWLDEEHKEPILDDAEKKYLKAVIRPWRDKVRYIMRRQELNNPENSHLFIETRGYDVSVHLPIFKTGTMYKGMKEDRPYLLGELGL